MIAGATRSRMALLVAVLVIGLGTVAATVIGGPLPDGPGNTSVGERAVIDAEPVRAADGAKAAGPRIVYVETAPVDGIEPGPGGLVVRRCPKGSAAINGYYFQTVDGPGGQPTGVYEGFGLDHQGSSPAGFRRWAFYWDNVREPEQAIDGVTFGIVCDRDG